MVIVAVSPFAGTTAPVPATRETVNDSVPSTMLSSVIEIGMIFVDESTGLNVTVVGEPE